MKKPRLLPIVRTLVCVIFLIILITAILIIGFGAIGVILGPIIGIIAGMLLSLHFGLEDIKKRQELESFIMQKIQTGIPLNPYETVIYNEMVQENDADI